MPKMTHSLIHTFPAMTGAIHCCHCNTVLSLKPVLPICRPCLKRLRQLIAMDPFVSHQTFNLSRQLPIDQPYCVPYCYQGIMRKLIHLFKIGQDGPAQQVVRRVLMNWSKGHMDYFTRFDFIVPVPSMKKLFSTSFPSASFIAQWMSQVSFVDVYHVLHRSRKMKKQTTLSKSDRLLNPQFKWTVRLPDCMRGTRVLLVDDVMTTGSTLYHCSVALKNAGIKQVGCFALAGGLSR